MAPTVHIECRFNVHLQLPVLPVYKMNGQSGKSKFVAEYQLPSTDLMQQQSLRCPCHDFHSLQSIYADVLNKPESSTTATHEDSDDSISRKFIDWISGVYNDRAVQERKILHCHTQSGGGCCIHRADVSSRFLSALHDGVRPLLQQQIHDEKRERLSSSSNQKGNDDFKLQPNLSNDNFPPLHQSVSFSCISKSNAKPPHGTVIMSNTAAVKRSKRRIRPVLLVKEEQTVTGNLLNLPTVHEQHSESSVESNNNVLPPSAWGRKMSDPLSTLSSKNIEKELVVITTTPKKTCMDDRNEENACLEQQEKVSQMVTPSSKDRDRERNSKCYANDNQSSIVASSALCSKVAIEEASKSPQINTIAAVYTAILNSCLVPSTIYEIHWLLRLLAVTESTSSSENVGKYATNQPLVQKPLSFEEELEGKNAFSLILSSPARCIYFSMVSLRNQSILLQGLGLPILRDLIRFPLFAQYLPDVTEQLANYIEKFDLDNSNLHLMIGSGKLHQTAHLTIPFKPERDSRHNFRTREGSVIYKNREECRDAFLFQLRTFLQLKGKMVDSTEASRALTKLRHSSRVIVSDLLKPNISWFAEVFIEMILQIGHIPIQETDTDLIRTVDKDKLQKLHQRFSSKASLPTNSNKILSKIIDVDSKRDVTTPPVVAAQQCFTGHQEFFFLFMMYSDSYLFFMSLRMQLITSLKNLIDRAKRKQQTEKDILDAGLLARFLGVLLFSPNWQSLHTEPININVPAIDELNQIAAAGLSIIEIINDGRKNGHLLLSLSLTIELLKVGKWDLSLIRSELYSQTVTALRLIQIKVVSEATSCQSRCQEFLLVRNILDSFFHEVVGLSQAGKIELQPTAMVFMKQGTTRNSSGTFSPGILIALAPQLEDLSSLVTYLSQSDLYSIRSPGVSKKLRPSVVNPPTNYFRSPMIPTAGLHSGLIVSTDTAVATSLFGNSTHRVDSLLLTLRDNFFHQHGELKLISDFTVSHILKNLRMEIVRRCIKPLIPDEIVSKDECKVIRENITKSCLEYLSSGLEHRIRGVMNNLAPTDMPSVVREMGIALTVTAVHRMGESLVGVLVEDEMTRLLQSIGNAHSKRLFAKNISDGRIEQADYYRSLSVMIDSVTKSVNKLDENVHDTEASLSSLAFLLKDQKHLESTTLPPENSLRQLYISMLQLDDHSDTITNWGVKEGLASKDSRWTVLVSYIDILFKLKKISHRGLHRLIIRLSNGKFISKFIELGIEMNSQASLSEILCQLVTSKIVLLPTLHEALLTSGINASHTTDLLASIENVSPRA